MLPNEVQLSRKKGWRLPPNTMSVARPGVWGNPFFVSRWRDAKTCVALFENAMNGTWQPSTSEHLPPAWRGYEEHQAWLRRIGMHPMERVRELAGKNLACWCALGEPCHRGVLLRFANRVG